jgi:hypothetical protein|tara:strand:- start:515 stop:1024 length:510 start_codon:yes stop_codon:yes gene_type:complete
MNIFYLDRDPKIAAQMHCDRHVVKMILESAQMLSTAHRVIDGDDYANERGLYKMAHKNHPSTIWVRSSDEHYNWMYSLMLSQMEEYTYRYDKHHATERLIEPLRLLPTSIENNGFVDPPMCMPEYCKKDDVVSSYQNYYIEEKSDFATWKRRAMPEWFNAERELLGLHG